MHGWLKLHRELFEKAIWKQSTPEQKAILMTILGMVNHEERQWIWEGEKYIVHAGQCITSLQSIAEKSGIGISTQNVRTALALFEKLEFLTNKSTKKGRLITIVNWQYYQSDSEPANKQTNNQLTKTQQRPNNQLTTNKNVRMKECKKKTHTPEQACDPPPVCISQKIPEEAIEAIKEAYLHQEYIEKAVTYAKDLVKQCPNIASLSWVEPYLKNEFPLILDRRKDINPQQILNCWMDACDTCAGKQNFNTNLLKTIFLSKINDFNPAKPPKNHVSKPIIQQKPKWRRYLEDYAELEEIFPPHRVFKTCDLEAKEPIDPRCTLISEVRHKNTDELINLDNLRPVKPDTS